MAKARGTKRRTGGTNSGSAKGGAKGRTRSGAGKVADSYTHPDQSLLMRPEVGTQSQFRKKKPPQAYRYDSSLSPALDWDAGNGARELGEWLLGVIEQAAALPPPHALPAPAEFLAADGRVVVSVGSLQEAIDQLKRLSRPFLDWTGKAERLSFDVPTLPLFVWLLSEWPRGEAAPSKFYLSSLPPETSVRTLMRLAKLRWRIERDYQEMKGELGLDHFEGRTWQGFHHHAALCAAAHAFLARRRALFPPQPRAVDARRRTTASPTAAAQTT